MKSYQIMILIFFSIFIVMNFERYLTEQELLSSIKNNKNFYFVYHDVKHPQLQFKTPNEYVENENDNKWYISIYNSLEEAKMNLIVFVKYSIIQIIQTLYTKFIDMEQIKIWL